MSRPTPASRPALALALAGLLALAGGGVAASGAPLCAGAAGADDCPMAAPAREAGRPCHGQALLAPDCCGAGAAPATPPAPQFAPQPSPPATSFAPDLNASLGEAAAALLRAPQRSPEAGLYTLHRAFLI